MMDHSWRGARRVFAVAVALGVTAVPPASAEPKGPDARLIERLERSAKGPVEVSTKRGTGYLRFIESGRDGDLAPSSSAPAKRKADGFLSEYRQLLGVERGSELVETGTQTDPGGATHVTYAQTYRGLPVFGAQIKAHIDRDGELTAVNGVGVPDIDLSVTPGLSADEAAARAVAEVAAGGATGLRADEVELLVYRTGLTRGIEGSNQLAYRVEVTDGKAVREAVFVHAHAGKVLNRFSLVHEALDREVYEQSASNLVWKEGDAFPGALNEDQRNLVAFSGDSYRHFFNAFGRDSYDGAGATMQAVANANIGCPNANWDHARTNYCNGVTPDDVVAHEWGHAYTTHTHDLIYQWQSGALNEAYSDIWGELVDLLNGAGTDSPGVPRSAGACSEHSVGVPSLQINAPASIAGSCTSGAAAFGPSLTVAGTSGDVVLARDGTDATDTSTTNGCTMPFTNDLTGRVALIDRGGCTFVTKVRNAQDAGAIAVVVGNNVDGIQGMTGSGLEITIPSLLVPLRQRNVLAGRLADGETVNATLRLRDGGEDSYRWLVAEDATAFNAAEGPGGHAIRDLWDPTCLGDPGKVSDFEYHCATSDGGGVHTNSGVPNHGFALLADGGTYNGRTVAPLGMTKAAHIYWRAQSVYQVPASDFADHADALEASCRDLIGAPLNALTTSGPPEVSGETIAAGDCAAVSEMAAAVELRKSPAAQCGFKLLLQDGAPALCAPGEKSKTVYAATFEDGLAGWTVSNQGVFSGWNGTDWQARSSLPDGRAGSAAYAANPNAGNCDGGAGDISGVMRLLSPEVQIPGADKFSPKLSFAHYVATEAGYDGGNVSVSVNGGAFQVVPAAAFKFNPYNGPLIVAGNTNPLAGQPAYTGTNAGGLDGSWGESQVDLTTIGVKPGDVVQVRFDFGTDGCTGVDGWYVDDVAISTCEPKARKN